MGRPPSSGRAAGAWVPVLGCVGCSTGKAMLVDWVKVANGGMTRYFCNSLCREVLPKWVMSCASLTRTGAVFSGIRILPSRVMNQPSDFSLAPVSWACSLSCGLYSGMSRRTGKAKHTLAKVASFFCTPPERAAFFAFLSVNPFPWLILSGQLVWARQ
jgi:hypothetical protein